MTEEEFSIEEPAEYGPSEFATATARYREARKKLLADPKGAEAHRRLGEEIEARIERKRATLAQVRQAVGLTQVQLAQTMGLAQGDISRIEQRTNIKLATLARFIEATGGRLRISAVYGETEVWLSIGDIAPDPTETPTTAA